MPIVCQRTELCTLFRSFTRRRTHKKKKTLTLNIYEHFCTDKLKKKVREYNSEEGDITPHCLMILTQGTCGRKKTPSGSGVVCFFSLSLSKGESKFRSESYALQIHGKVRGQGSGFQQHHISQIWRSVSPESSESRDGIWHVELTRQTQVSIWVYRSKQINGRWNSREAWFDQLGRRWLFLQTLSNL